MGIKTGLIRFNVKERGRRYRGQDRNFDTAALADLINGGEVQERVKNGDMVGYYGHWPRVRFGLEVREAGIVDGKVVNLEPAVRTTYIKAYPDGTIEHEAEFLDNPPGRLCSRAFQTKYGGFSSAIFAPRRGSMQVPESFHGFDYVLEPNYTGNRGYALDSAGRLVDCDSLDCPDAAVLDEASAYSQAIEAAAALLDRVQAEYDQVATTLTDVHEENVVLQGEVRRMREALDSACARAESATKELEAVKASAATPPTPPTEECPPPAVLDAANSRFARADDFKHARLEGFEPTQDEPAVGSQVVDDYLARAHGIR